MNDNSSTPMPNTGSYVNRADAIKEAVNQALTALEEKLEVEMVDAAPLYRDGLTFAYDLIQKAKQ